RSKRSSIALGSRRPDVTLIAQFAIAGPLAGMSVDRKLVFCGVVHVAVGLLLSAMVRPVVSAGSVSRGWMKRLTPAMAMARVDRKYGKCSRPSLMVVSWLAPAGWRSW